MGEKEYFADETAVIDGQQQGSCPACVRQYERHGHAVRERRAP